MDSLPAHNEFFARGRFAIVGCSRGLGKSLVTRLAGMGAELLLLDIDPAADEIASALRGSGLKAAFWQVDVRDSDALAAIVDQALNRQGLDGLVYLVRGRERDSFASLGAKNWDNDFNLTVRGAFLCARAAVPGLRAATGGFPSILFTTSILSQLVGPESVSYHAAKAALDQLTRFLAVQLGPSGIRVNAVQPGFIVQDEHRDRYARADNARYRAQAESVHPLKGVGFSEDVIDPMLFMLSPMAKFITGQILRIDGGLTLQDQSSLVRDGHPTGSRKGVEDDSQ